MKLNNKYKIIDNFPVEKAIADGEVFFELVDITQNRLLDFLTIQGNLVTTGDNDFLIYNNSDSLIFRDLIGISNFGNQEESAIALITGSVEHYFADKTTLALVAGTRNRARVQAPEGSFFIAYLVVGAVTIALKTKHSN